MKILLASNSPRRKELLQSLGFDFEVVSIDCDENFPSDLPADHVAAYISELKSNAFRTLKEGEVLKKLAYTGNNELGDFNDNKLKNIANVFKLFGLVNKDLDLKEFIYKENKPKIINLEISKQEKNIIITILISLFLIFYLIIILLR